MWGAGREKRMRPDVHCALIVNSVIFYSLSPPHIISIYFFIITYICIYFWFLYKMKYVLDFVYSFIFWLRVFNEKLIWYSNCNCTHDRRTNLNMNSRIKITSNTWKWTRKMDPPLVTQMFACNFSSRVRVCCAVHETGYVRCELVL